MLRAHGFISGPTNVCWRRLGRKMHHAVYVAAAAGIVHFWWLVKIDYTRPLIYSLVLAALLVARLMFRFRNGRRH